jgi:hypothetical protein
MTGGEVLDGDLFSGHRSEKEFTKQLSTIMVNELKFSTIEETTMLHVYTVNPIEHQPQWPANDNKPEPSLTYKMLMSLAIAICLLMLPAAIAFGLLSIAVAP